jgi:chromosome segregation ATPase
MLASIQKHVEGAAPLQAQLKEMQNHQARLQKSVDELSQQLGGLKASHTSLKEIQAQLDAAKQALADIRAKHEALRRDEARITAAMQVYEQTLLKTLKSEQSGSRDRLKTLETAVKDLEQVNVNTAPASHR